MWNVNKNLYETPEITEINRLPMHGAQIPFAEISDDNFENYNNLKISDIKSTPYLKSSTNLFATNLDSASLAI